MRYRHSFWFHHNQYSAGIPIRALKLRAFQSQGEVKLAALTFKVLAQLFESNCKRFWVVATPFCLGEVGMFRRVDPSDGSPKEVSTTSPNGVSMVAYT